MILDNGLKVEIFQAKGRYWAAALTWAVPFDHEPTKEELEKHEAFSQEYVDEQMKLEIDDEAN